MFTGRMGAADYWKSVLLILLIDLIIGVGGAFLFGALGASILSQTSPSSISGIFTGVIGAVLLAFIPALIAGIFAFFVGLGLQIRRLHDLNLSGWIILLFWVLTGVVYAFGRAPSIGTIPQYTPWAWVLIGLGSVAWLAISLWPGKQAPNTYGAPIVYRSWWAAAMGDKAPVGSLGKVFWILLTLVILAAVAAGAYIILHPPTTSPQSALTPEPVSSETETLNTNPVVQTTSPVNQPAPVQPAKTPVPTQPKTSPSPSSSITGLGTIPAGTFTNNTFLESNTFTTPKGTQTVRFPTGWQGGVMMDSSMTSSKDPSGLTIVVFKNPADPNWTIETVLVSGKDASFDLVTDEAKSVAKGTLISKSDVSFYGMSGYTLEQDNVVQGVTIRTKVFVVASATKVYQLTGTAKASDWGTYEPIYTASFATLQIH